MQTEFSKSEIRPAIKSRIYKKSYPENCPFPLNELVLLNVTHINFNGKKQKGELIVSRRIADDMLFIFEKLFEQRYPIEKIRLIDDYDADDDISVANNNSSAFCYRTISDTTTISNHAYGIAVDINPYYNPYIKNGNIAQHVNFDFAFNRETNNEYFIKKNDFCYNLFKSRGFSWGGDWGNKNEDYQHFYKELSEVYFDLDEVLTKTDI